MTNLIRKTFFVTLFLDYCRKNNHNIDLVNLPHIQMAITAQIKNNFPKSMHTNKNFRGLIIKP